MKIPRSISRLLRNGCVVLLLGGLLAAPLCLVGCNTTAGVGKDIKAAGNGLENAAEKAK